MKPTLDTKVTIPEDAPLSQDHDEDARGDAIDALDEHKKAAKAAEKGGDVGPRAPGDEAKTKTTAKKSD